MRPNQVVYIRLKQGDTKHFKQYGPSRPLRSADSGSLAAPRLKTEHGEAAWSCDTSQMRNKLPEELRLETAITTFISKIRTFQVTIALNWLPVGLHVFDFLFCAFYRLFWLISLCLLSAFIVLFYTHSCTCCCNNLLVLSLVWSAEHLWHPGCEMHFINKLASPPLKEVHKSGHKIQK